MTVDPLAHPTSDDVAARLRSRGLRVTGPRLTVYSTLARLGGHRSADQVAAAVAGDGPGLPRTSVYNALKALADAGLVAAVDAGPGTALYEVHGHSHHHFLCRRCEALLDVPAGTPVQDLLGLQLPGAVIESAQVVLRGVCPQCAGTPAS